MALGTAGPIHDVVHRQRVDNPLSMAGGVQGQRHKVCLKGRGGDGNAIVDAMVGAG